MSQVNILCKESNLPMKEQLNIARRTVSSTLPVRYLSNKSANVLKVKGRIIWRAEASFGTVRGSPKPVLARV